MSIKSTRIYYVQDKNDKNDVQKLNEFKNLYITTITRFEERIELYNKMLDKDKNKDIKDSLYEIEGTLKDLKNPTFENFFIDLGNETLEQIRYASVAKHTDKCIIRAVFDILFKYCFDTDFKISHLCCDNYSFKSLQLEILHDLRYKIPIILPLIQNQIQNQIQKT